MFLFRKTREGWHHGEDRAPGARKSRERSRSGDRRRARFQLEPLEGRQLLSWGSVPPALITPPVNSPPSTYVYGESLSTPGDAHGSNTNLHGEVDFYHFTATQGGTYLFDAASPGHAVDTVIAVYDSSGHRLAYDDDIAPGNTDSEASVALQAGHQYFLGVTNYISNTTHGSYNWSIDGPAHTAIEFKARALGSGFTGAVVSGLEAASGGYRIRYANCDIYDSPSTGAHEVHGAIRAEYNATAFETDAYGRSVQGLLGAPTSDEMNVPGVAGARMNTFQGGAIYWSPGTGAHVVYGGIGAKYNSLGGPAGYGLPTSDEANLPGVPGVRVTRFQNGAALYWSAATGAHAVYGAIGAEYNATAGETDYYGTDVQRLLGAPTSDEMNVPGVAGARMNTLQGGAIYWSPGTGANVVYGGIGAKYNSLGGPSSFLGLPTTDELGMPGGRVSYFQHGWIAWTPGGGAYAG